MDSFAAYVLPALRGPVWSDQYSLVTLARKVHGVPPPLPEASRARPRLASRPEANWHGDISTRKSFYVYLSC
jgi:hypothetical protein